ncbi:MAG TPA: calcium-binding protein, partial [Ramlibacter sp.]|nr:calcium-binding protein [Ramlibacter sp.]
METDDPNAVPDPGRALLTWMPDLGVTRIRARGVDPDGLFSVAELAGRFHPIDFVVIPHAGAAWAMLMYVPAGLAVDGGAADELLVGSHYADTLAGAAGDDLLVGNAGDDWIEGGAGSDDLRGGAGDDTLFGGSSQAPGADAMDAFHFAQAGNGEDEIRDFSFSDRIVVRSGVQVADVQVVGANGSTTLFLDTDGLAGAEVVIRLAGRFDPTVFSVAFADGFTVLTHGVFTGDGPDTVVLTDAAEGVHALGGDDSVQALAGNDTVYGGVGDDTVDGGADHDQLDGGAGNDWLVFAGATEAVTVDLLAGTVARDGLGGSDTAVGFEHVSGTAFDDLLAAGPQASHLVGGAGNDTLVGSGGADTLEGGDGVDTLVVDGGAVAPRRI